jgi:hypothetical protein
MSHPTITQNGALLHAHPQSGRRGELTAASVDLIASASLIKRSAAKSSVVSTLANSAAKCAAKSGQANAAAALSAGKASKTPSAAPRSTSSPHPFVNPTSRSPNSNLLTAHPWEKKL